MHGVKEHQQEDVEKLVMGVLDDKLEAGVSVKDISRTHRIGKKRNVSNQKPRPIIVRFISYRQRKQVFDKKKKLRGQGIVITESLTRTRYSLLQKCIEKCGRNNCWTTDGRIKLKCEGEERPFTICSEEDFANYL